MGNINIDDGRLEMDTDATGRVMDSLVSHGDQFKNALPSSGSIAGASAAIGTHHESCQQFLTAYTEAVRSIEESVTQVEPTFDAYAQGGRDQIAEYIRVDHEEAEKIKRAGRA